MWGPWGKGFPPRDLARRDRSALFERSRLSIFFFELGSGVYARRELRVFLFIPRRVLRAIVKSLFNKGCLLEVANPSNHYKQKPQHVVVGLSRGSPYLVFSAYNKPPMMGRISPISIGPLSSSASNTMTGGAPGATRQSSFSTISTTASICRP